MLGIMRKYKQSVVIKIVFVVIVLSFIGTIFLVWGRGDKGTAAPGMPPKSTAPRSPFDEFQKNYYRTQGDV